MTEIILVYYVARNGRPPFEMWFEALGHIEAARITVAVDRLAAGNFSNVKAVGGGVLELRVDYGPGYRVYFGRDGDRVVVLLGGGTKRKQDRDIAAAKRAWQDYRNRRAGPPLEED